MRVILQDRNCNDFILKYFVENTHCQNVHLNNGSKPINLMLLANLMKLVPSLTLGKNKFVVLIHVKSTQLL